MYQPQFHQHRIPAISFQFPGRLLQLEDALEFHDRSNTHAVIQSHSHTVIGKKIIPICSFESGFCHLSCVTPSWRAKKNLSDVAHPPLAHGRGCDLRNLLRPVFASWKASAHPLQCHNLERSPQQKPRMCLSLEMLVGLNTASDIPMRLERWSQETTTGDAVKSILR